MSCIICRCKKAAALAKEGSLTTTEVDAVEMDTDAVDAVLEAVQLAKFEENFDHTSV